MRLGSPDQVSRRPTFFVPWLLAVRALALNRLNLVCEVDETTGDCERLGGPRMLIDVDQSNSEGVALGAISEEARAMLAFWMMSERNSLDPERMVV